MVTEQPGGRMRIQLSEERREQTVAAVRAFWTGEFDEDLSTFRAGRLLDFMLRTLGPPLYNQAVADARAYMARKLEDLDGELYEPEPR
jgi:uncharacterized protein (DUF2164 family)